MMDSSPAVAAPSFLSRAVSAVVRADSITKVCVACLLLAWFFMATLTASLGSLEHGVRFFQFGVLIADPTRMFFPIPVSLGLILFGLLCLLCLLAPLLARLEDKRLSHLLLLLPLTLFAGSALILYYRSSQDFLSSSADATDLAGRVIRLANRLAHQGSDVISRHIGVAAGGYVSLIASLVLAARGVRGLVGRAQRAR
jgi:hypothetical protein